MKKVILFSFLALVLALCSCTMPTTAVRTVDDRPTLAFKGAPEGALLYIDGLNMGAAGQFNGEPQVLTIEPGTHTVRVTLNNQVIYEQRIFVESSLKTITIR
jgi:hypothetical protein